MQNQLMTGPEILEYLRISRNTFDRLVRDDPAFPPFKVGRDWRARPRELEAWIEKQRDKRPA